MKDPFIRRFKAKPVMHINSILAVGITVTVFLTHHNNRWLILPLCVINVLITLFSDDCSTGSTVDDASYIPTSYIGGGDCD
jgi:hypothetical protein